MPASGEHPAITIGDVITTSGATEIPSHEGAFLRAVLGHQQVVPGEEELLRIEAAQQFPPVTFRLTPNGEPLYRRYVERDDGAEAELYRRPVTASEPFYAQRYSLKLRPGQAPAEGLLEFQGGVETGRVGHQRSQRVVRSWVMGVKVSGLEKVNITERRGGMAVVTWAGGQLLGADGEPIVGTVETVAAEAAGANGTAEVAETAESVEAEA